MPHSIVTLITDYGLADGFVAACTGVITQLAPGVRILDVTHLVPRGDVRRGAVILAQTAPYLPVGVHVAVVDPGVGTPRLAVAVAAGGRVFVGPDNGLLPPAVEAVGGARRAVVLADPAYRLPAVSATFHGRDVFAPAAAYLALGVPLDRFGPPVDPADLHRLPPPLRRVHGDTVDCEVLTVDGFGNAQLSARPDDLAAVGAGPGAAVQVRMATATVTMPVGVTFASVPVGELVCIEDSAGLLAVVVNGGDAAGRLGLAPQDRLSLRAHR